MDRGNCAPVHDPMQLAIVSVGESFLFHHGPSLIHREGATVEVGSVELGDRLVGRLGVHRNETETFRTAGVAVRDDAHGFDLAYL